MNNSIQIYLALFLQLEDMPDDRETCKGLCHQFYADLYLGGINAP